MKTVIIENLPSLISFASIYILAVISPGPDFAIVVRNSLIYSRKIGLATAVGVSCGAFFHLAYTLFGLGIIITESPTMLVGLKYLGAIYIFYLGLKGLTAKKSIATSSDTSYSSDISVIKAFITGFCANVLNPKSLLFYVSIFSSIVSPNSPSIIIILHIAMIFIVKVSWFSFVALCLSAEKLRHKFLKITHIIERITGAALLLLSLKLLLN